MPIRLRGSHSSYMGRIEVHYAGTWGSVYASGWDIKDATVACRQLGYHSASLSGYRIFCSSDIPMWFTYFKCFGNETSLEQCARDFHRWYSSSTYCASVVCTNKMTEEGEKYKIILTVSITGKGKQARGLENKKCEQKQTWTLALLSIFCFDPRFHFTVPCSTLYWVTYYYFCYFKNNIITKFNAAKIKIIWCFKKNRNCKAALTSSQLMTIT